MPALPAKKHWAANMSYLVLIRHGQSEWNKLSLWTGLTDVPLSDRGHEEAKAAAKTLSHIKFDKAHTSNLKRAQDTLTDILSELGQAELHTSKDAALNERDYGDLTGKNKWQVKEEHGEEKFMQWRRSWDFPVPGGETLKDVHRRAVPYFERHILEDLKSGENVIVSAHGNTLRALVKYLEHIPSDKISTLEIATGEVYIYDIEPGSGRIVSKEIKVAPAA
jgi:2,3-bisphosphoglycerate-dependent phosphoglycerate mutase